MELKRLEGFLEEMVLAPGLAGFEKPVCRLMAEEFRRCGLDPVTDTLGNCMAEIRGTDPDAPTVMIFAHMDSLGFIVRYIEEDGFLRLERLGGIPEKALPSTEIQVGTRDGEWLEGVIGIKAHHVTPPEEKYIVDKYTSLFADLGAASREEVLALGIDVGSPVIYRPRFRKLLGTRVLGSFLDNRGGCAALMELAHRLTAHPRKATVWLVGTVLEEYNLRGAMVASRTVKPGAAICLDGGGCCDTPDLRGTGHVTMGRGPTMDLYNFHGRGTLNGTIPHPAMVRLAEAAAERTGVTLQRRAGIGGLTDMSYLELEGSGIPGIDLGFPMRYAHSPCEAADLADLEQLTVVVAAMADSLTGGTDFSR